jgi:hypothetical protein
MKSIPSQRREFLRFGSAVLAAIPVLAVSGRAAAATNAAMRTSLKYRDKPEGGKQCVDCVQFLAGKSPKDMGGCRLMPGDTEISPQGYCVAYQKKK